MERIADNDHRLPPCRAGERADVLRALDRPGRLRFEQERVFRHAHPDCERLHDSRLRDAGLADAARHDEARRVPLPVECHAALHAPPECGGGQPVHADLRAEDDNRIRRALHRAALAPAHRSVERGDRAAADRAEERGTEDAVSDCPPDAASSHVW